MTNLIGKYVIIRANESGVHAGILVDIQYHGEAGASTTMTVELTQARRLWYWKGAASISQLAKSGTSDPDECKFAVELACAVIHNVIEILPTTPEGEASIRGVDEWEV